MAPRRLLAAAVALGTVLVACGSRADLDLIEDAREAELAVNVGSAVSQPSGGGSANPGDAAPGAVDTNGPAVAPTAGPAPGADGVGQPGAAPTTGPGQPGTTVGAVDTRFAPPEGNGGATDVGVTEDEIVIGNVADITGAVAGLFADVQKAAQAFVLHFESTEGTIYGRRIRLVLHDTALTRNGNFTAYTQLCETALMAVASMSAFDEGIEEPVRDCPGGGFPDLRTVVTNPAVATLPTMYSGDAVGKYQQPMSEYLYWGEAFPEAVKSGAWVYVDNNTTREQTAQVMRATRQVGWTWKGNHPVDLAAISYKTEIRAMKDNDVRLVAFTGAYQQAAKLAREMVEESFSPDVYILQANVYDPRLIAEGGANLEQFPVQIAAIGTLVEEIEHSPELQLYREWLKFIDPEAEPTGLGMYAWSATRLAIKLLKQIGPNVTRARMLDALSQVEGWTSNDLVPAQDVGARNPADCTITLQIVAGAFRRVHPAEPGTFNCRDTVLDASP